MFVKIPIIRISILRSASSEPREKRVICHDILYIVSHFFFFFSYFNEKISIDEKRTPGPSS